MPSVSLLMAPAASIDRCTFTAPCATEPVMLVMLICRTTSGADEPKVIAPLLCSEPEPPEAALASTSPSSMWLVTPPS